MTDVLVLDTNVLLADPTILLSFPHSDVVIPETVLGELDKLKTARVDPDLRFRGREVSRLLFELSEEGSLVEGVDLPDGGHLRVAPLESDTELPSGLQTRNADDRILASVYQMRATYPEGTEITLITNDLNMLLKAQTLGIPVRRHGDGVERSFARRFLIRPFQRYRTPLTILAIAVAVFAGVLAVALYVQPGNNSSSAMPSEFRDLLSTSQLSALDAIQTLSKNPNDSEALLKVANAYSDRAQTVATTDIGAAFQFNQQAIRYYERYLKLQPQDNDARADLATAYFSTAQTDKAIQEVGMVLQRDKNHVKANFNLGIYYAQGRRDYAGAEAQFRKVITLTKDDPSQQTVNQQANVFLQQVLKIESTPTNTTGAPK